MDGYSCYVQIESVSYSCYVQNLLNVYSCYVQTSNTSIAKSEVNTHDFT